MAPMCRAAEVPKRMPLQHRVPKHDYTELGHVPQWLQDKENNAYEAFGRNPPPGHKPLEEAGFQPAAGTICCCSTKHAERRLGDGGPGALLSQPQATPQGT